MKDIIKKLNYYGALVFVRKEFYHVFRDPKTLLMLFGMPVVQIILFGFALTNEIKSEGIVICDYAHDRASQRIINKLEVNQSFEVERQILSHREIEDVFKTGKVKLVIVFPAHFNQDLQHLGKALVQIIADASDPNTESTLSNYATNIIMDYQREVSKALVFPMQINTQEFRQIFRNPLILRMIFVMPIVQLLVMPLAADYEIKNISISLVDHDRSSYSQKLINKISASGYFKLNDYGASFNQSFQEFQKDNSDLILEIPKNFEKELVRENGSTLFIAVNAINGVKASVGSAYLSRIISSFNSDVRAEWVQPERFSEIPVFDVVTSNWFNPLLNYPFFMVPGILAVLVTMVGVYMCALNIVKEKEGGTIEQINVTPIKKYIFILGKLIPFWIIGIVIFTVGLFGITRVVYQIVPVGSVFLLYSFLAIYLVALLGIGLLISTYSANQQQAMSLAFFCMMIFILMSGLFTSIESMPEWAKWIARLNPVTYFIEVTRMVVLKGSGFADIKNHFIIIVSMTIFFNSWAVWNYRKTS
ncbi:hypothetical protein CHS0354_000805 [Potamilus streckersoni]|uniref:ABC transmembrane type-2 domain-containing protein n=1 Tax=Potamilus streckersoni TaxID=2493646 RepID=A0AAE0T7F6_9BIVA|nr:hypothetical protein CHS0354_000805 [Potamilus streckersoni]